MSIDPRPYVRVAAMLRLDNTQISAHSVVMRRKTGSLVPLEASILEAALQLRRDGIEEVHGFQLAKVMRDGAGARRLTAYGTLYRALERLEGFGFLDSRWEDAAIAAETGRPPRRFYRLTVSADRALADAAATRPAAALSPSRPVT
jgi:PadR family transcriptional regulator, regulatory protein PadR